MMTILMIEDNECDIDIVKNIFEQSSYPLNVCVARSGEEAIEYLYKENNYASAITPKLIFLDLNLPLMNGFELLDRINQDDDLRKIPVIVLTTSYHIADINNAYERCISCYITKPMDINEFESIVLDISYLWLRVAKLPN